MRKRKVIVGAILFILFAISLYLVDYSKFGSGEVAKYNDGYGTVDMKAYDNEMVQHVLSGMTQEGIDVYKTYYWVDGIFIIFFGLLQCFISAITYGFVQRKSMKILVHLFPILRGICDTIENTLLYITLCTFPNIDSSLVGAANIFTMVKLWTIRLWMLEILVGIVLSMMIKINEKRKNAYDNKRKYHF
ncbi:MAG: hypothetical protein MR531_14535 [Lachnospiraceae bacterium]|nr:hypothetical protein [Lachnospiraceae bacterium]